MEFLISPLADRDIYRRRPIYMFSCINVCKAAIPRYKQEELL
jgi:hypothetical protein